ncbi:MAG: hypothetical protein H7338_03450 [Candidatus Sericytochromatia bacterium]|nr:hypothetical protein [Candidatus Sericytochromatia bacterium]
MNQMTPVARAYQSMTASSVRVSRPVGTPVDPSAWERRDRFVRGGPRLDKGMDTVVRNHKPVPTGDDAVWDRLNKTFQKHEDGAYRAYYAAEVLRTLPRRQRERLTQEFFQMHPVLIPLFLMNTWAPHVEALFREVNKTAKAFMRTLIQDFNTVMIPPAPKKGSRPARKPEQVVESQSAEMANLAQTLHAATRPPIRRS